jgi:hypothetical protein
VSGISSTASNTIDSPFAERRTNFEALDQALQSGDLQSAQSAFAALQQSRGVQSASSTTAGSANTGKQASTDLQAVGSALQSGDVSGAQQAFATLRQHRHHGHHHHQATAAGAPSGAQVPSAADAGSVKSDVGTVVNSLA